MSTLTHPYPSAPPPNPHDFLPTLPPHIQPHPCDLPSSCSFCALMIYLQHCHYILTLTHPYSLAPPPCPHDFPPMLPPHIDPHPSLQFHTPWLTVLTLQLHPHDSPLTQPPQVLPHPHCLPCSQFPSDAATTCPPSPPQLTCLHSRTTLKVWV
ncbi:hypothetical protein O181_036728 [Austropuccinia psidii MF-1]|uniref:Uncharacterized protein n=1 Tax=Austropuccinia psidii MF-1 TaxID=1389203 RepID=A0A9Q3D801_9BASI|nr:hypothetical protein [Austropuccinia psidii MF-1]